MKVERYNGKDLRKVEPKDLKPGDVVELTACNCAARLGIVESIYEHGIRLTCFDGGSVLIHPSEVYHTTLYPNATVHLGKPLDHI